MGAASPQRPALHHCPAGVFPADADPVEDAKTLFTGTALRYTEGAHLYHKEGWYYLLVAEGGTSYEHAVVVLRAKISPGRTNCTRTGR